MSLSSREIKEILAILDESGWDDAQVSIGDVTLSVSKGDAGAPLASEVDRIAEATTSAPSDRSRIAGAPAPDDRSPTHLPAPAPTPEPRSAGEDTPSSDVVQAPSVGVFWRSPEPGAPPFVELDEVVEVGQTLCIVEVMKLMQHVIAEVAGVVSEIHRENGDHVEFGTPLFSIVPMSA